ncbi:unnamed protein product [Ectocarpus fasciculatus]
MSTLVLGCALLAFNPAFVLSYEVAKQPPMAIVALAGAFSYLLSILVTSMFWAMMKTAEGEGKFVGVLFFSSILQNAFRVLFIRAYRKTEYLIKDSSEVSDEVLPLTDKTSSVAGGLGFGFMHALVVCGSTLASGDGEGHYFSDSCPYVPLVLEISIMALGFFFIDVIVMCLAFIANRTRSSLMHCIIFVIQLSATLTSLGNREYFGCRTSLSMLLIIVIGAGVFLAWVWPLLSRGTTMRRRDGGF